MAFFSDTFSIEAFGLFLAEVEIFFQVLQYFSRFLQKKKNTLFFQVWPCFSRFSRCGGNPAIFDDSQYDFVL